MLIFSVFFLFVFCNISLRRPTCLNQPLRQSKAALFSIFCFISLSGVKPAHDQPPPHLYFLIYPHHFLVLTPKVFGSPVCSDTRSTVSSRHLSTSVQSPISTCRPHLRSPVPRSRLLVFHLWPRRSSQTAMCVCVFVFVRVLSPEPTWPRFTALRLSRNHLQNTRSRVFTHVYTAAEGKKKNVSRCASMRICWFVAWRLAWKKSCHHELVLP